MSLLAVLLARVAIQAQATVGATGPAAADSTGAAAPQTPPPGLSRRPEVIQDAPLRYPSLAWENEGTLIYHLTFHHTPHGVSLISFLDRMPGRVPEERTS